MDTIIAGAAEVFTLRFMIGCGLIAAFVAFVWWTSPDTVD